jgi:predicted ATPase
MSAFQSIQVREFRRLKDFDLELKALNVMIGANGSGKTSLLEAFSLLAASASGSLTQILQEMGGAEQNSSLAGTQAEGISFALTSEVAGYAPLNYRLSLRPSGKSHQITDEFLTQQNDPHAPAPMKHIDAPNGRVRYFDPAARSLVAPEWDFDAQESALSQVPRMYQATESFRKRLASSTHYHALDVRPRSPVRLPQPMREAKLPGKDGEDLVSCLYWLREAAPDRYETIEDTLRAAFPDFERLNFPPVAAGTIALTWKDGRMKHPFYMHQLSEGTLRFLWLVTLLYSPGLTEVTLIDEPEVSLHPELLAILAECLREASQRTQLIVATHADRLVRFLQPGEIVVMDSTEEGATTAARADQLNLEEWMNDYTLDQIWQHGTLGGRA